MTDTVVVGVQWGDEGKGKLVDWLAGDFDVVVRFQGGNNAGHTLVVDGDTYKLSMLPSGAIRPGILSVIGSGTVLEPWAMLDEVNDLRSRGIPIDPDNLVIADNVTLILKLHKELRRHARRCSPEAQRSAQPAAESDLLTKTRSEGGPCVWPTSATKFQ